MNSTVQAIDDDANQTAQMTAALLDWPQGTFASKVGKYQNIFILPILTVLRMYVHAYMMCQNVLPR